VSLAVLHVSQPTIDGVAVCVERLATAQHRDGWRVAVACPDDGPLPARLQRAGVRVLPWAASRAPGARVPAELRTLSRLVDRESPDVVHLHSSKAGLVGRLALRGQRPTLFQPHAWSFSATTAVVGRAALRWERVSARWTDVVLCGSDSERELGIASGIRAPSITVGNGVDIHEFPLQTAASRASARAALGLGPAPLAVFVGRFCDQKGQDLLLDAWPEVREAMPAATLLMAGYGPQEHEVRRRTATIDGIDLRGRQDEIRPLLAAADVFVMPSRYEGLSLTLLEAMASGRSVVAHDVVGVRDVLSGYGSLVPLGDTTALAKAVVDQLRDPAAADAVGQAAHEHVARDYAVEAWVDRIRSATEAVATKSL
jgi:glycosyltransferase involved in cell wall biosynthesis